MPPRSVKLLYGSWCLLWSKYSSSLIDTPSILYSFIHYPLFSCKNIFLTWLRMDKKSKAKRFMMGDANLEELKCMQAIFYELLNLIII